MWAVDNESRDIFLKELCLLFVLPQDKGGRKNGEERRKKETGRKGKGRMGKGSAIRR